jgi:hypothetical protein
VSDTTCHPPAVMVTPARLAGGPVLPMLGACQCPGRAATASESWFRVSGPCQWLGRTRVWPGLRPEVKRLQVELSFPNGSTAASSLRGSLRAPLPATVTGCRSHPGPGGPNTYNSQSQPLSESRTRRSTSQRPARGSAGTRMMLTGNCQCRAATQINLN